MNTETRKLIFAKTDQVREKKSNFWQLQLDLSWMLGFLQILINSKCIYCLWPYESLAVITFQIFYSIPFAIWNVTKDPDINLYIKY